MNALDTRKLLTGALIALALGACHQIAGIEDRVLDPNPSDGGASGRDVPSAQCQSYCSAVMSACSAEHAVYSGEEMCLAVCALLDPGDLLEPVGNTVACRAKQADLAKREPEDHCKSAGPGGNGVCGSDCDAYCQLFAKACADDDEYKSESACLKACGGLTDLDRFDLVADHEGDSIECRLVHVSSATLKPADHCSHAPVPPTEPWCTGKADASPTCDEYCNIQLAACDGDLLQYESRGQCLDVCEALEPGLNPDQGENTVACRRYHSFSSTFAPETHCYHSGPTGDGHCGDAGSIAEGRSGNCDSYCRLLEAACPAELASLGDAAGCFEQCLELDEAARDSEYSVDNAKASTGLSCRVLHVARAFEDPEACAAAVGGGPCQP
jgi:hypothetical protein